MKIYLLNHNYKNIGTYFRAKKIFDLLKDYYEVTLNELARYRNSDDA